MNKQIVAATAVIAGSGVLRSWLSAKPVTPVIMGSYIFMLLLSLLDMFGGDLATLASALALLTALAVLIMPNESPIPLILQRVGKKGG